MKFIINIQDSHVDIHITSSNIRHIYAFIKILIQTSFQLIFQRDMIQIAAPTMTSPAPNIASNIHKLNIGYSYILLVIGTNLLSYFLALIAFSAK